MPQTFQVLRCYKCLVFQVHPVKKCNKLQCKLCGEKQSIKRHYGIGTAKECRLHVQKLNGLRGDIEEINEYNKPNETTSESDKVENSTSLSKNLVPSKSKWSAFVQNAEKLIEPNDVNTMKLNNFDVVLEIPKKCKKRKGSRFKCPSKSLHNTENNPNIDANIDHLLPEPDSKQQISNFNIDYTSYSSNYEVSMIKVKSDNKTKGLYQRTNESTQLIVGNNSKWMHFTDDEHKNHNDDVISLEQAKEKNSTLKKFCTHTVTRTLSNSKWAQFVEANEHNVDSMPECSKTNSQDLFALCDDKDLDDVLNI